MTQTGTEAAEGEDAGDRGAEDGRAEDGRAEGGRAEGGGAQSTGVGGAPKPVAIVAVGVAPSARASLISLLGAVPEGFAAAFVLLPVQEADPGPGAFEQASAAELGEALTPETLTRDVGRPVEWAQDGMPLQPGSLLLAPPACMLTMADGHLVVQAGDSRGLIDTFAVSMADQEPSIAVLVMLSSSGDIGTLGTTAVKAAGGLAFAEARDGATPDSSDIADFVLPPEMIPARIVSHFEHIQRLGVSDAAGRNAEKMRPHVAAVTDILLQRTGHDFHGYKERTFTRRLARRLQVREVGDIEQYLDLLRSDGEEVHALFQDLLIGVTQFFRDPAEFEVLAQDVIPNLVKSKTWGDKLRVWVLGCATGEEAYSLAILIKEHLDAMGAPPSVQIFATDIDGRALASARAGRFAESISQQVSPERLQRWFVQEGNTYAVAKELRELCVFSAHNILRDPPFSRIDLISCRNLLIYLSSTLQSRVIPLFHFALRPGGVLFLGPAENVTRHSKLFEPIDRRHRIFRRQDVALPPRPDMPISINGHGGRDVPVPSRPRRLAVADLTAEAERIAAAHAPPFVVVDDRFEVLHFSGRMGRYLEPAAGQATLNLLNLVHRELRLDLRGVLHRVISTGETVHTARLPLETGAGRSNVTLLVERMPQTQDEAVRLVVIFRDAGEADALAVPAGTPDDQMDRLDAELQLTKERLQSAIEELETTNEELKASNEEYQSVNEELQSTNEELETSKEELQSLNEELQTVNGELARRVSDLARANSDLRNVLESTQIAIVFLDNDLRIKNFTPAVTEVLHLVETDAGRLITHIGLQVTYPDLADDVRRVLRTLATVEREVENPANGKRYLVRALPYRSVTNFIAGVVLTFLDITALARAEKALRDSDERFRKMASAVPNFLFITDGEGSWQYVNPPFYSFTGVLPDGALDWGWLGAVHPDDADSNRRLWQEAIDGRQVLEQECRVKQKDGAWCWFLMRAVPQFDGDGLLTAWFGSCTDIDERRRAERRQRLLLAELQHRVKNILSVVRSVVTRTLESSNTMEDFAAHLSGRIGALARTRGALARTPDEAVVLEHLLHEELAAHGGQNDRQIEVDGPTVLLPDKVAETLGLAMHELTTNALKYGALSVPTGRIRIQWRTYPAAITDPPQRRLVIEWQESGVPVTDLAPERSGFGRELIEYGLPYELGASTRLEFLPGGVRCLIEFTFAERENDTLMLMDQS